jgi:hypothetical protein
MAMLIVYKKVSEATLRKEAKDLEQQVARWFEVNPKRRVCRVVAWYDRKYSIKRKDIKGQLSSFVDQLVREGRTA